MTWRAAFRIVLKAALLFALVNLLFAALNPLEALGRLSLYNRLWPGRERLPYGENPAQSYNLSLNNIPAMIASHAVSRPKADDEFRLLILGDSAAWGWFLTNRDTLAGQLNAAGLRSGDGRRVVAYNLGYPVMSLTKDLLLLDAALASADPPDAVLWLVTLESFPREKQLFPPLLQHNPQRVRDLITRQGLRLDPADPRLIDLDGWGRTLVGQRRALADWLRLQTYGLSWAATGIDQFIPADIPLRQSDFEADESWQDYDQPTDLTAENLALEVLVAGVRRAGVPLLLVNEPMFISDGINSALRYNAFYPRWAYDAYRALLADTAADAGWNYLDVWDAIPPEQFTDSPVHLTPAGSAALAARLRDALVSLE